MNSDRQRLVGAIRRIAGIGTQDGERASESSNRGSQPGSVGRGITESDDRLCCDGSVSGNVNPGTNTNDPSENEGEGLDPNDPADIPGNLSGLTDCETGDPVCFSGSGFVPPDGWSDPMVPPPESSYEDGYYWSASVCQSLTAQGACRCAWDSSSFSGQFTGYTLSFQGSGSCTAILEGEENESTFSDVIKNECSSEVEACAGEVEEFETAWPSDGCVNLAIIDGRIVGSKFDPENDGSYSAPRDEIPLCDDFGNQILIRGSAGGGWKSIARLDGDIDPDTDHGYLYSAYGDVIRQISPSEFRDDRV